MVDDGYVTVEACRQISDRIGRQLDEVLKVSKEVQEQMERVEQSLYGSEKAGLVKGGLVHMVTRLLEDREKSHATIRWFMERLVAPIITAVIVTILTLAVHR